jgi:hypothetical protein
VLFVCTGDDNLVSATAVTYGGQAGTQIVGYLKNDAAYLVVQAWYWLESAIAAAGSTTFSITSWVAGTGGTVDSLILGAAAFSGVHQTVPFGTPVVANGSSTAPSTGSITVGTDELAIGSVATDDDNAFTAANTSLWPTTDTDGVNSDIGGHAQSRATTGALTWTTDNFSWAAAGVAVKPSGGAAETVTVDKWFPQGTPMRRRTWQAVPSGTIGIRNT